MYQDPKKKDLSKKTRFRTLFGESVGRKTLWSLVESPSICVNIPVAALLSGVAWAADMPAEYMVSPLVFAFEHAVVGRFMDKKIRDMRFGGQCVDTTPDPEDIMRTQEQYGQSAKVTRRFLLCALPIAAVGPASAAFSMSEGPEHDTLLFLTIAHGLAMTLSTYIILYNLQKILDEKWALSDTAEYAFEIEAEVVEEEDFCLA